MKDGSIRTDVFTPQTFIQVGFGGLVYWGENDSHRAMQYRVTPALDAGIGRYFTPAIGARLMYGGLAARGSTNGLNVSKFQSGLPWAPGENWYKKQFDINYVHADLLWNLSNTLGGFRADRPWEFVPYVGIGYAFANKKGVKSSRSLAPTAGLINKIRISPRVDINLDARYVFVKENFDGVKGGKSKLEYFTTATLGFSYYFKKREVANFTERVFDTTPFDNRISGLERDLEAARARAGQLERDLQAANNRPAREVVRTDVLAAPVAIFFPLNKATLDEKEKINLQFMAETIKKTDKTYTIFGSADKQTGSPVYNQRLSERRAQAVMDELVKLGVNRNQLRLNPVGDTQQRFGDNKPVLNRVVVVENK